MESTRPIRALARGLEALNVLNMRDGTTVSEAAREIGLPRTTVFRLLATLCAAGFVFRDPTDERYRLTIRVRGLSCGFDDEAWVEQIAKPLLDELCGEVLWPVALATRDGASMVLRATTDHDTPLAAPRLCAGMRLPLLGSAAGRVHLAFCPPAEREALLEPAARAARRPLNGSRAELTRLLDEVRSQGYAQTTRARDALEEVTLAVPVSLDERRSASLSLRFTATAVAPRMRDERYLPKMRQCAARLRSSFSQRPAEAPARGAPLATA